MAEILVTMAVGPLLSMVKEKASSYLLDQYKVMKGMEEQHEVLKRKLPAILDVIADAEMQAAEHREGAKAWLEAVRKMTYQGNDVFDEFKYEALRRKAKEEGHYHELGMDIIKLFPTHNRFAFRIKMGKKLNMILQNIEGLIGEMNAFSFKFQPQQQLSVEWRHTDSDIIDPMDIASKSRAKEKKMIVDTLLGQKSNDDLTVLPIFGMGGLGKTTLAQLIYNDSKIQDHFQLLVWMCVSNSFDVDFLARSIVEAITNSTATVGKSPLHSLREAVSGKRYLLVLDDVWNHEPSKWDVLKFYLEHGDMGSSILTTTRDESIARFMGTTEPHKLGLLDQSFLEEIIKAKAFNSKDIRPENKLAVMVSDMAKKCAGSPLAASALGSVLRTKTSVEEWETILSRSTICDNETGILPILKLSYNDLPSQMRQCFSFCAVFPKDYEIDVEMLILLWMANGFIFEEQGVCPEIKGKQIFTELASKSFFQDVKEISLDHRYVLQYEHVYKDIIGGRAYGFCSRITCKIHDLMHDVAQFAMGKECGTIATESSKSEKFPYSTRHLCVPLGYPKIVLNGFLEESFLDLQTFLCITEYIDDKVLQFLSKCNYIRALQLGKNSPFLKPKHLHHLRYLDISGSRVTKLPEDISILYHLQTLKISGCYLLAQLPRGMKYMTSLRHLYNSRCSSLKMMPPELRYLTSLRTLTWFVAGTSGPSCSGVAELGPLDDLGGRLEVRQLENITQTDAQATNLENKKRLTELALSWSDPIWKLPQHDHNKVIEGLRPHEGIKVLKVYRYGGSTCPAWMNTLHHVVELVLFQCKKIKKLPALWRLPALQVLYMKGMEDLQCFCGGGDPPFTFKKLKELELDGIPNLETLCDINEVEGQEPMFPELQKLSIEDCRRLTVLLRAPATKEPSGGVINTTVGRSACPALKELKLHNLTALEKWEEIEGTLGEHIMPLPSLEKLLIEYCPELTTLPEAPKLNVFDMSGRGGRYLRLRAAANRITSPSTLTVTYIEGRCDFLFPRSSVPALWKCFVQLEVLEIVSIDSLEHWPGNVFQCLVSLRRLKIKGCRCLTGRMQQASEKPTPDRSLLPPHLESLVLKRCFVLVEVPTLPASLRELSIHYCDKLEFVTLLRQQMDTKQEMSAVISGSSTAVIPSTTRLCITLFQCRNLQSLSVQLDCTELLDIRTCESLKSLDGNLPSLERLILRDCSGLVSIPDGPQAYSSLRHLSIRGCPGLKVLPPCLTQRLDDIEETDVDASCTGSAPDHGHGNV